MSEYIKREDAIEELKEVVYRELASDPDNIRANTIIDAIEGIRAADVEPVVRGEWKWYDRKEAEIYAPLGMVVCAESYVCSNCGKYIGRSSSRDYRPKYCDNCGAHMIGAGNVDK